MGGKALPRGHLALTMLHPLSFLLTEGFLSLGSVFPMLSVTMAGMQSDDQASQAPLLRVLSRLGYNFCKMQTCSTLDSMVKG